MTAAEAANGIPQLDGASQSTEQEMTASITATTTTTTPNAPAATTATQKPANGLNPSKAGSPFTLPAFSPATEEILKRVSANSLAAASTGTPGWEAAREAVIKSMATSDKIPTPPPREALSKRGRGGKKSSPLSIDDSIVVAAPVTPAAVGAAAVDTPALHSQPSGRGRGRGRGPRGGLGRGSGRGRGRGGARGGKRRKSDGIKREYGDDDNDDGGDASDSSEIYTPLATTTRSGRAVAKPTTFVPSIPSPTTGQKRKRPFNRKNPELAVCKVCLRPHSPATNMIVFCDGCNTPYHRYCHHPPIDQQVVDVIDMEWYCSECNVNKPAEPEQQPQQPQMNIDAFVSGQGLTEQQKRASLSLLPASALVTLLLRADAIQAQLPIFPPGAYVQPMPSTVEGLFTVPALQSSPHSATNGQNGSSSSHLAIHLPSQNPSPHFTAFQEDHIHDENNAPPEEYDDHPEYFPRPGYGLARTLPPEEQDLDWLVDDNYEVYNHIFQTDPQVANDALLPGSGENGHGAAGIDKGKGIAHGNGEDFEMGQAEGGA